MTGAILLPLQNVFSIPPLESLQLASQSLLQGDQTVLSGVQEIAGCFMRTTPLSFCLAVSRSQDLG